MSSPDISINLQFPTLEFRARDRQNIRFTLTNNSNETLNVLKWNTPLEGINNDLFRIEKDRKPAVYLGKKVKREAPIPEDYITMEPRGSVSVEVDLTEYYDISEPGQYDVRYRVPILDVGRESPQTLARRFLEAPTFKIHRIQSNVTSFVLLEPREPKQINGISLEWLAENPDINAYQPPSFTDCSTTQETDLENALTEAEKIANKSRSALSDTPLDYRPGAIRYREWFGNYDNQRYDEVTDNFEKILDALANKTITFNCSGDGCGSNWVAYVYPGSPYEIHLCSGFWRLRLTGTDSKSGTIVHEISHFNVVAGTGDNAYGQENCRQLAIDNPTDAIANADSHEYFAENNPFLPMITPIIFARFILQTGTALHQTDDTFDFAVADLNRDGTPEVIAIKKSNTDSRSTEVHILNGANPQQFLLQTGTALHQTDDTFDFAVADWDGDGISSDLVAIKKSNTDSRSTEVHILSGASNFQKFLLQTGTALHQTDDTFDFAVVDVNRDRKPDLIAIKKSNTDTNSTEVHILSGASNFQKFLLQTGTALHQTDDTFDFAVADWDGDGASDLVAIKKSNTDTNSTEVHILSGAK